MNINKKNKQIVILSALAVIFFFIYSFLLFGNSGHHFTWPDETANYFFIKNYTANSSFSVDEPLNKIAGNLVRPRSFNVYQYNLVPGSFLGMLIIYGLIGKIAGIGLISYLTPLLAALAGLFFYKIILKVFDDKIAFISTLLFFINPSWWYYANFAMLPNIAFIALFIIGFYFLVCLDKDKKQNNYLLIFLGALFIALALTIRTNEFLWVALVLGLLLMAYYQKIKWQYALIFVLTGVIIFLPTFYYNHQTYGNFLSFGYLRLENGDALVSQLPTEFKTTGSNFINFVKFIVLPFGFHPKIMVLNFYNYFIKLFWWLFIAALFGSWIFLKKYHDKQHAVYFLIGFCISLYLLTYYGSWVLEDTMTVKLNKIGISYVRYFLPLYILILPLIAIFFRYFINFWKNNKIKIAVALFLIVSTVGFTMHILYFAGEDNLIKIKQNIKDYNQINQRIINLTEDKAVIISQRSDKIFFPERKVIGRWSMNDFDYWEYLLYGGIPLYYYSYEGDEYMNEFSELLYEQGYKLQDQVEITPQESIYKIKFLEFD